jgi:hypothetical protein
VDSCNKVAYVQSLDIPAYLSITQPAFEALLGKTNPTCLLENAAGSSGPMKHVEPHVPCRATYKSGQPRASCVSATHKTARWQILHLSRIIEPTTITVSLQISTSRISNNIDGCLPSSDVSAVPSVKLRTMRGTEPMMRTANFSLRFPFSPALVFCTKWACPADRLTRNPSALISFYPGFSYLSKCDPLFKPCRAPSRRSSIPKSGGDRFERSNVRHNPQGLSMLLEVVSVGHGTVSRWFVSRLGLGKHRDP